MKESYLTMKIRLALEKAFPKSQWTKIAAGPYQQTGLPDLIGCVNGYFIGIEVKLPSRREEVGAVTVRQQKTLDNINNAGGFAFVAYDAKEAVVAVNNFLADKVNT